jgi:hypothetical protein
MVQGNAVFHFTATWRLKVTVAVKPPLVVSLSHDQNYCSNVFFQKMEMFHAVCISKMYSNSKHNVRKT